MSQLDYGKFPKSLNSKRRFGNYYYTDVMMCVCVVVVCWGVGSLLVGFGLAAALMQLIRLLRHSSHGDLTKKIWYAMLPRKNTTPTKGARFRAQKTSGRYQVLPASHIREIKG